MPTYDYRCKNCEHEFELFQQMSDSVKKKCPECGKLSLQRLIGTGSGVIFKGGGFYQTDYRSDSYKKGADAEKKASDSKTADKGGGTKSKSDSTGKTESSKSTSSKSESSSSSTRKGDKSP